MLKLRKLKESEKVDLPMVLPPLFWISSDKSNYFSCFRSLTYLTDHTNCGMCVVKYNKQFIGTECWVCLDLSNGSVDNYRSRFYCWIFNTKEDAEKQYQKHKTNNKLATLKKPVKCIIVDEIDVRDSSYYYDYHL